MAQYNKPELSEEYVVRLIEDFRKLKNASLESIRDNATSELPSVKFKRERGTQGFIASKHPSIQELELATNILLADEFLKARKNDTCDFDPYQFMGIQKTPTTATILKFSAK